MADYGQAAPGSNVGPFIMNPEGVARLFSIDKMNDGPFPEHYEPIESPIGTNPLHPAVVSPARWRVFSRMISPIWVKLQIHRMFREGLGGMFHQEVM